MKDALENVALKIHTAYREAEGLPQASIDPTELLGWGKVLVDIFTRCQEKKAQGMISAAKKPRLLQRIVVTNALERNTDDPRHVVKAKAELLFEMCTKADPSELQGLIDEVHQ